MTQLIIPGVFLIVGLIGLWQVFVGWRWGKMFAFDPTGSSVHLERSDGCLFVAGWWLTLLISLGGMGLGAGMLLRG